MGFNKNQDWNFISTDDTCGKPTTHLTEWGMWLYIPGAASVKATFSKEELTTLKRAIEATSRKMSWGTGWQTGMVSVGPGKFKEKEEAIKVVHQLEAILPSDLSSKLHIKFFAYKHKAKKACPPTTPGGYWVNP